jgi:hypothetical protein
MLVSGKTVENAGKTVNLEQLAKQLSKSKATLPKDDPHAVKRMLAPIMNKLNGGGLAIADELVIGARNQRTMEVLDRELKAGKKRISIFFGSGHMKDFVHQLEARGWKKTSEKWVSAWTIPAAPSRLRR